MWREPPSGAGSPQVSKFLKDDKQVAAATTLGLVSRPIDDLVLSLLRLDGNGKALADLTSKRMGPVMPLVAAVLSHLPHLQSSSPPTKSPLRSRTV